MKLNILIGIIAMYLMIIAPASFAVSISNVKSEPGSTYAEITWETDEEAVSKINYGKENQITETKGSLSKTTEHYLILGDLDKETWYYFEVMSDSVLDNNNGEYYQFYTKTSTQLPLIEADIPEFVNSAMIDIKGNTDLYVRIELYVNGVKVRKKDPKPEKEFSFADVNLNVGINNVRIDASDLDGNVNSETYSVIVDTEEPVVNLLNIPSAVIDSSVKLKGSVNEEATVTILVNAEEVYNETVTEFDQDVSLQQGNNLITIGVEDKAGNTVTLTRTVLYDDEPPEISAVDPETGSFFYEGHAVTDIKGIAEPGARIELYYNKEPDGKPRKSTLADANGRFEFKDFNLEYGFTVEEVLTGRGREGIIDEPVVSEPGATEEYIEIAERDYGKAEELGVKIYLVATDAVGLQAQEQLQYRVGTCFSGDLSFDIINMNEYQAPTLLSPERLEQGTELITFVLNITYRGIGKNAEIKDVRIERACEATEMQEDDKYKYSCGIMSSSPNVRKSNEEKTLWFIRYDLQGIRNVDGFSHDLWEDLTRQTMIFPLKIRIEYTEENIYDNNESARKYMTKCLPVAYSLDKSIDPRNLPDGLLTGLQGTFNSTIEGLNKIIPWVNQVTRIVGLGCFIGFLSKLVVVIMKRFSGYAEHFADRPLDIDDPTRCPAPGRSPRTVGAQKQYQDDYTNEELAERCPETYSWWETEANFDYAMKWACDRFLCRAVPAGWTSAVSYDEIRTNIEKASLCGEKVGTQGTILRTLNKDECQKWGAKDFEACYQYEGELYVYKNKRDPQTGNAILERVITGGLPKPGVKDEITVTQAGPNSMLSVTQEESKDCKKSCTDGTIIHPSGEKAQKYKWKDGGCLPASQVSRLAVDNNYPIALNNDKNVYCPEIGGAGTSCYCWDEIEKPEQEAEEGEEFNYRLNKVKLVNYNKYKYYQDRDFSACFGANNLLYPYDAVLNPRDLMPAVQCACVSQVRARLIVLRNMLYGFNNCIEQVKLTGTYNTGVCREIFTQYICKWASRVVSYMMEGCMPFTGTGKDVGIGDNLQAFAGSVFGGAEEAASDLMSDYDSPALRDYFGVGEGAIAQKVCLGALTGDWGLDFEGFMDAAYETPFHTAVQAFPAEREYLTWDPSNEQSTYDYRIGWMIAAGCDIQSYDVMLGCISESEYLTRDGILCEKSRNPSLGNDYNSLTGCDCLSGSVVDRKGSGSIYQGRSIPQGAFEDKSVHVTQDSLYRYDHVIIKLNVADPDLRSSCFPDTNPDGIFYFPITDVTPRDVAACRFDQSSGQFVCNAGSFFFNQRGSAYFGKVQCDEDRECEDMTYYAGDSIVMNKFEVYNQGPEKCLHWEVNNRQKQTIMQGNEGLPASTDEQNPSKVFNRDDWNILPQISTNQFSRVPAIVSVLPTNLNSGMRHESDSDREVVKGTSYIWFIDTNNDKFGDEIILGKNKDNHVGDPFTGNDLRYINGAALKFVNPEVPSSSDTCTASVSANSGVKYPCFMYTLKFEIPTVDRNEESVQDQVWTLHFDIRALPENGTGYCQDATEQDIITARGEKQTRDLKVRISSKTKSQQYRCNYLTGTVGNENTDWCDCDNNQAYKDDNDCDGKIKRYCYYHKNSALSICEEFPRCFTGSVVNSRNCDCNQDGVMDICTGLYCDANTGQCTKTAPTVNNAPEIDEAKSTIGTRYLSALKDNSKDYLEISKDSIIEVFAKDDNVDMSKIEIHIAVEGEAPITLTYDSSKKSFKSSKVFASKSGSIYVDMYAAEPKDTNQGLTKRYYVKIPTR